MDTPPELARRKRVTNLRGIPVSEPYRGFFKRTHLHTTLNKSRDERTEVVGGDRVRPLGCGVDMSKWFRVSVFRVFRVCAVGDRDYSAIGRHWCSGNIGASQALAPGSIPGWRMTFCDHFQFVFPLSSTIPHRRQAYLLGRLAKIKCSICS